MLFPFPLEISKKNFTFPTLKSTLSISSRFLMEITFEKVRVLFNLRAVNVNIHSIRRRDLQSIDYGI